MMFSVAGVPARTALKPRSSAGISLSAALRPFRRGRRSSRSPSRSRAGFELGACGMTLALAARALGVDVEGRLAHGAHIMLLVMMVSVGRFSARPTK